MKVNGSNPTRRRRAPTTKGGGSQVNDPEAEKAKETPIGEAGGYKGGGST